MSSVTFVCVCARVFCLCLQPIQVRVRRSRLQAKMFGPGEIGSPAGENPEKQCRLCLKSAREYYSLTKRFEDTPPVHAVIRTLLSYVSKTFFGLCFVPDTSEVCGLKTAGCRFSRHIFLDVQMGS